jgi:hypothetical protein
MPYLRGEVLARVKSGGLRLKDAADSFAIPRGTSPSSTRRPAFFPARLEQSESYREAITPRACVPRFVAALSFRLRADPAPPFVKWF